MEKTAFRWGTRIKLLICLVVVWLGQLMMAVALVAAISVLNRFRHSQKNAEFAFTNTVIVLLGFLGLSLLCPGIRFGRELLSFVAIHWITFSVMLILVVLLWTMFFILRKMRAIDVGPLTLGGKRRL